MKVNFSKIIIKDIEGRDVQADFQKQLGNQLYMQGRNIEECELGKRIYFADGEVELTDKECAIVRNAVQGYSYIARSAIENQLKKE
jgi:hypothetical protein